MRRGRAAGVTRQDKPGYDEHVEPHPQPAKTLGKICGVTRDEDATAASSADADFVGVIVEVDVSPRSVTRVQAVALLSDLAKARRRTGGVALLYDAPAELAIYLDKRAMPAALQLAGTESPETVAGIVGAVGCDVWKSLHLAASDGPGAQDELLAGIEVFRRAGVNAIVLDSAELRGGRLLRGGTGTAHDWDVAANIVAESPLPVMLAGGLSPDNVAEAIRLVRPAGVDVSSGVEISPGVKDPSAVKRFIAQVRSL